MSKEYLEALKTIKIKCHPNSNPSPLVDSALEVVEQALQRLESIDNAKPSEALECLEKIKDSFGCDMAYYNLNLEYETVEKTLLKAQEQEKVLEIIKEKNVNIFWIKESESLEEYNYNTADYMKLTEEEFELLKRHFEKNIQK